MVGSQANDGGISRQRFLRALIAARVLPSVVPLEAAAEVIEPFALASDRGGRVDSRVVESYTTITAQHRQLYWTASADMLLPSALGHTRAERCFEIATTAVRESGDHALAAVVYAHWSFLPGFAGDGAAAAPLLDAAAGHVRYAGGPLLRSWLHCVHSEVSARTGAPAQSVRHARQAEDSLSTRGDDPEWLDFFDPGRLASFLGYSQLVAGRTADAVASLQRALDQLDDRAGKQRSVVLLDLAAAHAMTDAEHGMDFATQAFDQLEREPYGTAHGRVAAVRRALEGTPQARVLDERVQSLPAVG